MGIVTEDGHGEVEVLVDARGFIGIAAISATPDAEARQERGGFRNQLARLPFSGAHDEDEAFGLMPGGKYGLGGGECGLAPLAGTVRGRVAMWGRELVARPAAESLLGRFQRVPESGLNGSVIISDHKV